MSQLNTWAKLLGGEVSGVQVLCPGPGHSAKDRSLSVKVGKDGQPVVHSHAGDDWKLCLDYVRQRLGMEPWKPNGGRKTVATYEFRDPTSGAVRYRKERLEGSDGTKDLYFKPKGRGGSAPLLYGGERLADVADQPVFIVEGEKMVDRLRELGAVAVSGDTGWTSKWLQSHAHLLRGLHVVLWPDSDEDGEKYISSAAKCLQDSAASIKVVRPFGPPNGAKGRDVCDWTGNPEDLAGLVASAEPYVAREQEPEEQPFGEPWPNGETNGARRSAIRFPLVALKDIVFNLDEEWRVEGVLPLVGLAVLYGAPGAVKSFILQDLFVRMARGGFWGGRKVEQSAVIYIAAEGSGGVNKRLYAMRKGLPPDVPFYLIQVTPNLGTGENDCKKLIEDIEAQLPGVKPGAIAVDTTSQALGGADENTKGMAQLVANATAIFNRFKCLVALIHHTPLSDEERLRGGTPLIGGVDVSILSKYTKGSLVAALTVMKMRDDDAEQSFTVHLSRVVLGKTKTGREVSTLVVESVEPGAADAAEKTKKHRKLSDSATNVLNALSYALGEAGAVNSLVSLVTHQRAHSGMSYQQAYSHLYSRPENVSLRDAIKAEHMRATMAAMHG